MTEAQLDAPYGAAVDSEGNLYISDTYNNRIRKVGTDGIITTIAGNGIEGFSGDGGPAINAQISYPFGMSLDKEGNLFFVDDCRIRKIGTDGIITTVAGNGICSYGGDGGLAVNAQIRPLDVKFDDSGNMYISDTGNDRIRKVGPDGIITTVAGSGSTNWRDPIGDGDLAIRARLDWIWMIAVDNHGNILIPDAGSSRVRKVSAPLPSFTGQDFIIPSEDGKELYGFDATGKHLKTVDTTTGVTAYTFAYDTTGYLSAITDKDGNITTIERDSSGNPTAIIAPGGQRTELTLDSNGYLASITNPAGDSHQMTYSSDGLLLTFAKPRGNTSVLTYDGLGRLIKDEDAAGGFKALSRTEGDSRYTVFVSTAEGIADSFTVENLSTGDTKRTNTDSNGLTRVTNTGTDGTTTTTAPDGTITTTIQGPDPRFGMQAPLTKSMTIKTPSGLTYNLSEGRTVSLSDTSNPLSIVTMTDTKTVNGKVFTSLYDAATKKITATTPVGRQKFTLIDNKGRIYQEQTAGLNPVTYGYDEKGRLTTITEGSRVTTMIYDSLNQISSITDAASRTVSFAYDLAGRVTQQTLPDSRIVAYTYDPNGNITSITPPGRPSHAFTYDPRDLEIYYTPPAVDSDGNVTQYLYNLDKQLTSIIRPDGKTVALNYDSGGRLAAMSSPDGQISYSYNVTTGNLSSVVSPGETLSYSLDGSLLTSQSWSGAIAGSVGFGYNNDFRVASESVNGANSVRTYP